MLPRLDVDAIINEVVAKAPAGAPPEAAVTIERLRMERLDLHNDIERHREKYLELLIREFTKQKAEMLKEQKLLKFKNWVRLQQAHDAESKAIIAAKVFAMCRTAT